MTTWPSTPPSAPTPAGPRLPSIRSRLTRVLVGVALAGGLVVSGVTWLTVQHETDELLDETLQASAEVLGRLLAGDGPLPAADTDVEPERDMQSHFAWQVVGPDGQVLLRSARAPARPWLPLASTGFSDAADGWRVFGRRLHGSARMLYVAQTGDERREAAADVVLAAVSSALLVALATAWWLRQRVAQELRPLQRLSAALADYEPLRADASLPPATRRDLQPVHAAIEDLGRRLAGRVANERAFTAHAAHALRTPLAGIDTQLAVAEREAPPALQPRLSRVREAAKRLARVVAALLALFRSGPDLQWQALDLAPWLARLPLDGLQLDVAEGPPLQADADLLSAALINLLDNALRHGATRLRVQLQVHDGVQTLQLHDDGHGTTPERRAALAAALDSQSYEGRTGLGLMLADLVARAHGGRLLLPAVPQGFAVALQLGPPPGPVPLS